MSTPEIVAYSPHAGPDSGGTTVAFTVSSLTAAGVVPRYVLFGGNYSPDADLKTTGDTSFVAVTPPNAAGGGVPINIDWSDGTTTWELDEFIYVAVNSVSPQSGTMNGGTLVTISGTGLSQISSVLFNDTAATNLTKVNDSQITVIAPKGDPGIAMLSLLASDGNPLNTLPSGYTYVQVPTGLSLNPTSGPATGSTPVNITGSGLSQVLSAILGSNVAAIAPGGTDNQITVIAPPSAPGNVDVSLFDWNADQVGTVPGGFTYLAAATGAGGQGGGQMGGGGQQGGGQQGGGQQGGGQQGGGQQGGGQQGGGQQGGGQQGGGQQGGGQQGGGQKGGGQQTGDQSGGSQPGGGAGAGSGPTPGSFIPGGLAPVPGGQTGLGGTAGTGAGFGVGTLLPGGGGSAPPSNLPYYVDPALTAQLVQTLIGLVQNAASPDALESQNILLRRLALEGDVIGSRVPPPRNISEIGGYLNLLSTLKESAMREQTLAGVLGVAGPSKPLGWISNAQPLAMVAVTNDRPPVAAQPSFPLTVLVRSDFVGPVQKALKQLHSFGATLPLVGPSVIVLPPGGTGATPPTNILLYLGRSLMIAPAAALANPVTDPVALIRPSGATTNFVVASNVLSPGTVPVTPADFQAVQCTPATQSVVTLDQASFVPIAPILGAAGFYSPSPVPVPPNNTVLTWTQLTNTTGLVAGSTELGDELSLLYRQDQIVNSVFASMLGWTWNGTAFASA